MGLRGASRSLISGLTRGGGGLSWRCRDLRKNSEFSPPPLLPCAENLQEVLPRQPGLHPQLPHQQLPPAIHLWSQSTPGLDWSPGK